ncbi:MAG TPA: efflux RND transporter periplasmic adaptor subunit [Burkholderiaceae bacterium]|nr:efflux RND transporter periplasmic adaptor subunit [Burkholderiaceae bacterium]
MGSDSAWKYDATWSSASGGRPSIVGHELGEDPRSCPIGVLFACVLISILDDLTKWLNNNTSEPIAKPSGAFMVSKLLQTRGWPALVLAVAAASSMARAEGPALATLVVAPRAGAQSTGYDGTVEAVRQTSVASQVVGAVVALQVRAGDRVKAGQVLVRLDARAAEQQAGAATAQVQAAKAAQDAATTEFERQRQLFQKNYISQAALERAEAQYKAATAQAAAQLAAANAAHTETGYFVVKAPYDGIVSEVPVMQGDMAMPGRPLLTMYDPSAMRVSAAVPESAAQRLRQSNTDRPTVELAGATARLTPTRWEVLPAADPTTHTVVVRLDLPAATAARPGMFARAWLPGAEREPARIAIPANAVVRRAELKGVYVVGSDGKPLLRQVRLGPASGDQVEVLSGLAAGERVALDPQAAARVQ